jgi:hypothetical protein
MSIHRGKMTMKYAWSWTTVAVAGLSAMAFDDVKAEKCLAIPDFGVEQAVNS